MTIPATEGTTYQILVDGYAGAKTPPTVTSTSPASGGKVNPGANAKATFSEPMQPNSVNTTSFKLRRAGTTRLVGATVTYDSTTWQATLNPNNNLRSGSTYVTTVTTDPHDEAGNALDQNPGVDGNQPKTWKFTVN